jgi:hypothetical protein
MRVWVVTPGEPAVFHPTVSGLKIMRSAALARALAQMGHEVIWWTGSFQHHSKEHLEPTSRLLDTDVAGLKMWLVPSPGYQHNISVARFNDYAVLTQNWLAAAETMEDPDVIVASWPPVDLGHACVSYGRAKGAAVYLDARDLWPDVIYQRIGAKLRLPWVPRLLWGYNRKTKEAFAGATGVLGITQTFVDWGLRQARRERHVTDRAFYLSSYSLGDAPGTDEPVSFWRNQGLSLTGDTLIISWVGSLTDQAAVRIFLERFANLPDELAAKVQLVICGTGALGQLVSYYAARYPHMLYPGYIDRDQYSYLLTHTDHGLLVYDPTFDFLASIPNKVNEYLSGGVGILTNLDGEAHRTLAPLGASTLLDLSESTSLALQVEKLLAEGKISRKARSAVQAIYREKFDAETIYRAMAAHVLGSYSGQS